MCAKWLDCVGITSDGLCFAIIAQYANSFGFHHFACARILLCGSASFISHSPGPISLPSVKSHTWPKAPGKGALRHLWPGAKKSQNDFITCELSCIEIPSRIRVDLPLCGPTTNRKLTRARSPYLSPSRYLPVDERR